MSTRLSTLVLSLGLLAATAQARPLAGIVVLKNGQVIIGRIDLADDTHDQLVVRWPYKKMSERGETAVAKFRIRWYDRDADEPTDAYWRAFEDEVIDEAWLPARERWRLARGTELERTDNPLDLGPPWEGTFANPRVSVTFRPSPEGFSGTVTARGETHPAHGTVKPDGTLAGSFEVGSKTFELSVRMDGETLVLTSGASSHRLERVTPNPLDAPPSPPEPRAPGEIDLSHLRVGERFTYAMKGGVQMVWTITAITPDHSVRYTTQALMDMGRGPAPVGDPTPAEFPHARQASGAAPPAGTKVSREKVRIGTVEFDCLVTETVDTKSYIAMQGDQVVFPGCVKSLQAGSSIMELIRIDMPSR